MALTGDFSRLQQLRQKLMTLSGGGFARQAATELANATQQQIIDGFNAKRDPYGRPWAPRRPIPDWVIRAFHPTNHPLMDKSGALIDTAKSKASGLKIRVTMKPYAKFHQDGTVQMVARKLVPDGMNLGPIWGNAYLRTCSTLARQLMGVA